MTAPDDSTTDAGRLGRKAGARLPPDEWGVIRRLVCAGRPIAEVAQAYGVTIGTITARSNREQWPTPARESRRKADLVRKCASAKKPALGTPGTGPQEETEKEADRDTETQLAPRNKAPSFASLIQSQLTELQTVASDAPDRFGETAGRFAQVMLAAGFSQVEPPRTVRELAVWEDLRRKFLRLDAKDQTAGLFAPVAPMRRAVGPVVDVPDETTTGDAVDGFEV